MIREEDVALGNSFSCMAPDMFTKPTGLSAPPSAEAMITFSAPSGKCAIEKQ